MILTQALKKAMDRNPDYGTRLEQAQRLAKKWQRLGLLQGFDGPRDSFMRTNVAIMLQNQAQQILRQANHTSTTQFHEEWVGIAMPLVRRLMHKLAAKQFVTVQAMSQPTGLVFFIDHQFGSNRRGFEQGKSIYGSTFTGDSGSYQYTMNTDLEAGLYGAGKWGYSLNQKTVTIANGSVDKVTGSGLNSSMWNHDSRFSQNNEDDIASGSIKRLSVVAPSDADLNGYDTFLLTAGDQIERVFRQYTSYSGGKINFLVKTATSGSFTKGVTLSYHRQPITYDRGDFEYQGEDLNIGEVQFKLTQKPIVPQTRKLKSTWTQELIDDMNALLAIDGQQEISNQLTDTITLQTDLEIIAMIGKGAMQSGNRAYWSARPGYFLTEEPEINGDATFALNPNYVMRQRSEWFKDIGIPMLKVSNNIHAKTGKGGANFAIVSSKMATVLESIPGFSVNNSADGDDYVEGGFTRVGDFQRRYKIYKNPYAVSDNTIIMGYRGTGFLDFGAAYCPYIPLVMLPNIYEPTNLTPTKGVYTRYAKTMLRNDFYGVVFVEGLQTI